VTQTRVLKPNVGMFVMCVDARKSKGQLRKGRVYIICETSRQLFQDRYSVRVSDVLTLRRIPGKYLQHKFEIVNEKI
jgi:hypothetical protein